MSVVRRLAPHSCWGSLNSDVLFWVFVQCKFTAISGSDPTGGWGLFVLLFFTLYGYLLQAKSRGSIPILVLRIGILVLPVHPPGFFYVVVVGTVHLLPILYQTLLVCVGC